MARGDHATQADMAFGILFDRGLSRRDISEQLDLTSSQYDIRRRRLLHRRKVAA